MKGCFLLQRGFAHVGHDIAWHLKTFFGIDEFCGYVYLRSSYDFLKRQDEIKYTALLLDEEIHKQYKDEKIDKEFLAELERDYGLPFLWPYLAVDRVLMSSQLVREYPFDYPMYSHEDMLRILQVKARAVLRMLKEEKPDFLFCTGALGGTGSLFLYHAAKKLGIPVYVVLPTLCGGRYILSEVYETFSTLEPGFEKEAARLRGGHARREAEAFLEKFRQKPVAWFKKLTPSAQAIDRRRQFRFLQPSRAWRSLAAFVRFLNFTFTQPDRFDYSYITPWNQLKDKLKRKYQNLIGQENLYEDPVENENYAFFPLHLEPEVALLLQAPYYTNQLNLIRQIARSLPVDWKLYVKEHPQMVEYRPRRFYNELKKIPNVRIIRPSHTSYELIAHTRLLTTITGSAGWEAVLFGKPVINFGRHFYNALSAVKRCTEIENLPALVKDRIDNFVPNEEELLIFLAAVFEDSVDVDLYRLWEDETDPIKKRNGVRPLAELLAKKLRRA